MNSGVDNLISGYKAFADDELKELQPIMQRLWDEGQAPHTMVIGCSDSRVDPGVIFSAGPGDLFMVRNVANLVPPPDPDQHHHGTSAAIEFAVTALGVNTLLVMGHSGCGGIQGYIASKQSSEPPKGDYLPHWLNILDVAWDNVDTNLSGDALQEAMEREAVRQSMLNLMLFPFVQERVGEDTLEVVGARFSTDSGALELARTPDFEFNTL